MQSVVWTGHLHFGLVVMPVSLFAAARAQTTRFKRIHRRKKPVSRAFAELTYAQPSPYDAAEPVSGIDRAGDGRRPFTEEEGSHAEYEYSPVRQVLQSEGSDEEIRSDELVKGYEYGPNQFAVIEPAVIERAAIETSETIDLFHFVQAQEVDPLYFERSYYVAPDAGGEKAYTLLLEAMGKEGYFGIARIGMHKREHMLILRPTENCIVAHTMFYENEVRRVPEFEMDRTLLNARELSVARALINGYSGVFEPEKFKDIYQERIKGIIREELTRSTNDASTAPMRSEAIVPDLMESIRRSLDQLALKNEGSKPPKKRVPQSSVSKRNRPEKVLA